MVSTFNTQPAIAGFRKLAASAIFAAVICLLFCVTVSGQYFTLPGTFFYAGVRQSNQVFDVSPDGKIAIALRNDPVATHPAFLTTFDPILGTEKDNKTFGFGPLEVRLAQVGNALRAVVLTSEWTRSLSLRSANRSTLSV